MLNQFMLVGRIKRILFYENTIVVAVTRSTKEGDAYLQDNVEISVPKNMMDSIENNCHVETMVGVKGVIRETAMERVELIAEKITYLGNTKHDTKGGEE